MKIAIAGQIAEAMRELAMRKNTYPRLIGSGKMKQSEADLCLARMEAIRDTLLFCQQHEADIRSYIAAKREAVAS
ncbi:MAG: hypothetical protein EOQ98_19255 [Mesorhizobium sp.]|uniref:hypothetical protein n=1 Tax=Mesorhizobium sp. TaxID=1871066 RepID=UPI000FD3F7D6|nr:hypothetical protein [Mesorhizobium sp.]RUU27835.1 hypothetical protein EOD08_21860 [Mesorhizobium sp. M6A.T.Ca.TU.002.02.2.1]RWO97172.1 MAG: hypothetical protein EOQ98_19255 [Mesorhizobium sp.]TIM52610.1 MAG: hypothetical protein E5Y69_00890 [Mesorhizobium sp.]